MNNGKEGEKLFAQIARNRNYQVQDVSANPNYYYKGDFILTSPTGQRAIVEVKWDQRMATTGNLYLEIVNTKSQQALGWYESCSGDYLAYGDAVNRQFYFVKLEDLRKRVAQLPKRHGYCGNNSAGLLVSIKQIEDICLIIKEEN